MYKIKSLPTWGTVQKMNRNEFIGFNDKTALGMRQVMFEQNPYQSDYVPMMEFFDTVFTDIKDAAAAWIMDPLDIWINLSDCG